MSSCAYNSQLTVCELQGDIVDFFCTHGQLLSLTNFVLVQDNYLFSVDLKLFETSLCMYHLENIYLVCP